ncbi:hypothetical protein CANCADRAFT_13649, partial [Tortispora caseinolytica NRRL Y-17796]
LPQLIEQWKLKSSDGISLTFITAWFIGDITNLIGAIIGDLLPQVIALAVWFCIADCLIIVSTLYYRRLERLEELERSRSNAADDHLSPLLERNNSLAGRRPSANRRRSSVRRRKSSSNDSLTAIIEQPRHGWRLVLVNYVIPLFVIILSGAGGFFLSGSASPSDGDSHSGVPGPVQEDWASAFGYISAVMYLAARIPQIIQNHKKRSVHGLSLLFFILSTLGNLTYGAQIIVFSTEHEYLMLNLPWLIGSLGTIVEDLIIFAQFYIYRQT